MNTIELQLFHLLVLITTKGLGLGEKIQESQNVFSLLGQMFRLACDVNNKTEECQWTKDGSSLATDPYATGFSRYSLDMTGSNGCVLIIDPVQFEDEGLYHCQVGAATGVATKSKPVNLTVNHEPGLPHILQTKHGDVMKVLEGEEIVVECESQGGKPAADIVWKHKDGADILASEVVDIVTRKDDKIFKTHSMLKFIPMKDEELICTSFSDQFSASKVSTALKIKIKYKPRIFLEVSKDIIIEGDKVEVTCKANAYPVNIVYRWFIDNDEIIGENRNVLKIENIQKESDKMKVKCIAANNVGSSEKMKVLILIRQPKIVSHPKTSFGRPGEKVTLSCQAEGSPPPRYIWVKSNSNELVSVGQNLTLVVSERTEGGYVCIAAIGDHEPVRSGTARLVMKRKPILETRQTKTAVRGRTVLLNCRVRNLFQDVEVVWAKQGLPLVNNIKFKIVESYDEIKMVKSSDLIITNIEDEEFTNYSCFASNELGSDYKMIEVVEETSDSQLTITLFVNIISGLVIFLILGLLWLRRRRSNVVHMEEEKMKNSDNLNNQKIFKNVDRSVFDQMLIRKDCVIADQSCHIDIEFQSEEKIKENERRISQNEVILTGHIKRGTELSSPNDSVFSSRTALSYLEETSYVSEGY